MNADAKELFLVTDAIVEIFNMAQLFLLNLSKDKY